MRDKCDHHPGDINAFRFRHKDQPPTGIYNPNISQSNQGSGQPVTDTYKSYIVCNLVSKTYSEETLQLLSRTKKDVLQVLSRINKEMVQVQYPNVPKHTFLERYPSTVQLIQTENRYVLALVT